jgi:hypothetical protein
VNAEMESINRIFTFWEPRGSMPGYLRLCMRTWGKFLPEHEIVLLDYSNLEQWIGKDCYPRFLNSKGIPGA